MTNEETINELLDIKGYKNLRDPQKLAVESGILESDDNFIIISPTATGKTFTAELCMFRELEKGGKALYLVPSHSLIREKVDEFQYLTERGYTIGTTKDENAWESSDILLLTFESFFINILMSPVKIKRFSIAIFDEFHILYDRLRGFNLEKSIILVEESNIRIICLSATFEDKDEIAEWLKARLVIVPEHMRRIELKEEVINIEDVKSRNKNKSIFKFLIENENYPYLIFCNTKPFTISRARDMMKFIKANYDFEQVNEDYNIKKIKSELLERIRGERELTDNEILLCECLSHKVGFHNALLDEEVRNYLEERLLDEKINWVFTTTTLAYGFNSPTKSVVIFDNTFWDPNRGRIPLPVWMYVQMIGRAGRPQYYNRRKKVAFVYMIGGSTGDEERFRREYFLPDRKLEKAKSHLSYDDYSQKAILQLIFAQRNQGTEIINFFEKSLNAFQASKNPLGTYDPLAIIKKHVEQLIESGFIEDVGGGGYRLSPLGKVTVKFISFHNKPYLLNSFKLMYEYVKVKGLTSSFETVYQVCKFLEINVSKKSRIIKEEINEFFASIGVDKVKVNEIAAYALWNGWIENKDPREIESMYDIYADNIKSVGKEASDGMWVMEKMYEGLGENPPKEFINLRHRVRHGVRKKEVCVVLHKGYGRAFSKDLWNTARQMLAAERKALLPPEDIPNDNIIQFYGERLRKGGRESLKRDLINNSRHFKVKRAQKFTDLIEKIAQEE